jgi:hypothetical protein
MAYEQRPGAGDYIEYYGKYVARVPEGDIVAILATQVEDTVTLLRNRTEEQALGAYAPGKWTMKEVIGHLIDVERVMSYRALLIARGDTTPLAGFDENTYVPAGQFNQRALASLLSEFTAVRRATVAQLAGLPEDAWLRAGTANDAAVTVRGIAWIIAGHELHHRALLVERYMAEPVAQ